MKSMTSEEFKESLVSAGICTKSGKLTKKYKQPIKKEIKMIKPTIVEKDNHYWIRQNGKLTKLGPIDVLSKDEWKQVELYSKRIEDIKDFEISYEDKQRKVYVKARFCGEVCNNKFYFDLDYLDIKFIDPDLKWLADCDLADYYNDNWVFQNEHYKKHIELCKALLKEIKSLPKVVKNQIFEMYE